MNTPKYHEDHYAWAKRQATLLGQRRYIAEELEDVGGSERREVVNRLGVQLAHLIKWRYQPDARSSAWASTI